MLSVLKEHVNLKFLVKLEKTATEPHTLLKQVYVMNVCHIFRFSSGLNSFQIVPEEIEVDQRLVGPSM